MGQGMTQSEFFLHLAKLLLPPAARRTLRDWVVKWFPQLRYPWWIARRVHDRRKQYSPPKVDKLFSLLTPVFNTPPRFLRELAECILDQDYPWFEWVVVDNGSTSAEARTLLRRLTFDPRVKLVPLTANRGIMAGTRAALEHACGRYILPVDHDDRLYPDALRIMAYHLHEHHYPAAAYSDEDKLLPGGRAGKPFCKPDWDPLLLLNCGYVAHLSAVDREAALELECYTDPQAEGCPDWDAFLRLARAGHAPVHVPEILYSWRMHADSTADPYSRAKPYTIASQHHALTQHLWQLNLDDRLTMRSNPLVPHAGLWRVARRQVSPTPPIHVLHIDSSTDGHATPHARSESADDAPDSFQRSEGERAPRSATASAWSETTYPELRHRLIAWNELVPAVQDRPDSSLIAIVHGNLAPLCADWPWETLGLFELFDDLAIVGGRIIGADGRVQSAGEVFGMAGLIGSPCRGWPAATPRRHGMLLCQRTVSAVDGRFFVARAGFLASVLRDRGAIRPDMLSAWLAAAARARGLRIAYSPHILAQAGAPAPVGAQSEEEMWDFLRAQWPLLADDPYYSPFCSLRAGHGWELAPPASRAAILNAALSRLAGFHPELSSILARADRYQGRRLPKLPAADEANAVSWKPFR